MAEGNLDRLKSDIKLNQPARLYVFHGEEAYLRSYYLDALRKLLVEDFAEAFNYHRFGADTISLQAVLDSIEALPMMSQRSMVQIDDVNFFTMGEDGASYAKFFSNIPDYCTVVLVYDTVEYKIDRRKKALAEVFDRAVEVNFTQPSERELMSWIGRHLKKAGKRIAPEDAQYLIHRSGGAMTALLGELGKLSAYVEEETVTRAHIDLLVEPVLEAAKNASKQVTAVFVPEVYVQHANRQFDCSLLVERCKEDFKAKHNGGLIRSCKLYVKPEDNTVYYVINDIEDKLGL